MLVIDVLPRTHNVPRVNSCDQNPKIINKPLNAVNVSASRAFKTDWSSDGFQHGGKRKDGDEGNIGRRDGQVPIVLTAREIHCSSDDFFWKFISSVGGDKRNLHQYY